MKEASDCEIGKEIVTRWESLDDVERKEFEALSRKEKEERKKIKKLLKASFYVFCIQQRGSEEQKRRCDSTRHFHPLALRRHQLRYGEGGLVEVAVVLRLEHNARKKKIQLLQCCCCWALLKEWSGFLQQVIATAAVKRQREIVQ